MDIKTSWILGEIQPHSTLFSKRVELSTLISTEGRYLRLASWVPTGSILVLLRSRRRNVGYRDWGSFSVVGSTTSPLLPTRVPECVDTSQSQGGWGSWMNTCRKIPYFPVYPTRARWSLRSPTPLYTNTLRRQVRFLTSSRSVRGPRLPSFCKMSGTLDFFYS